MTRLLTFITLCALLVLAYALGRHDRQGQLPWAYWEGVADGADGSTAARLGRSRARLFVRVDAEAGRD